MGSFYNLLASFFLLAFAFSPLANASCNGPLQDFCVAIDEPNNASYVNGKFCKNPDNVTVDDFTFDGLDVAAEIEESLGFGATRRWVPEVPGLNTQGISMARIDFLKGGVDPPHWHPRSAELFHVYEGHLLVGFVTTAENNYTTFATVLGPGEGIVFGQGLTHFAMNVGKINATAFVGFNHEFPGISRHGNSLFDAKPSINYKILMRGLKLDKATEELAEGIPSGA
ncbi:hypothetical protein ACFE04_018128 [Oxalis oulophora]